MKILSIKLTGVVLLNSLKVFTDTSREYGEWEVEPEFTIGFNDNNQCIQNVEVEVIRTIGIQHASIRTKTSFELVLGTKEYIPATDEDFEAYALFQQLSIAHTRAFFLKETRGTKFQNGLIPVDSNYHAIQKVKFAVFNTNR